MNKITKKKKSWLESYDFKPQIHTDNWFNGWFTFSGDFLRKAELKDIKREYNYVIKPKVGISNMFNDLMI